MEFTLARDGAARRARRLVAQCCEDAATSMDCSDTAVLLTSEVVTNALLHGRGTVRLRIDVDRRHVRVEVADDNPQRPRLPEWDSDAEGGRGMRIVDALASAWGVDGRIPGKVLWFEVACHA